MSDSGEGNDMTNAGGSQPGQMDLDLPRKRSKAGAVVALVVLAVIIVLGIVAYNALSSANKLVAASVESSATAKEQADDGQSSGAAEGTSSSAKSSDAGVDSNASGTSADAAETGDDAPMLADYNPEVSMRDGTGLKLSEIAAGMPLVVNFWATWCPYCIQEMDDYQSIYDEYADRVSFAFIDCADGRRETVEKAAAWLEENGYELPAYYDTSFQAQLTYGVTSLPTTVIVSADGEILGVSIGAIDPERVRSTLDSLI